jgi:hypothetical protein
MVTPSTSTSSSISPILLNYHIVDIMAILIKNENESDYNKVVAYRKNAPVKPQLTVPPSSSGRRGMR